MQQVKEGTAKLFGSNVDIRSAQGALLQSFTQILEERKATCAMHTLGFTSKHDAAFLSALTRAGTSQVRPVLLWEGKSHKYCLPM